MKRVYRGNLFFFIIIVWGIVSAFILSDIFRMLQIFDPRIKLFIHHLVGIFIPSMLYIVITKQKFKDVLSLRRLRWGEVLLVIMLGIVCIPFTMAFGAISSLFFENTIGDFMGSVGGTPYIILMLLIAVMPAITEEVSLRGVVLSNYHDKGNFKTAIIGGFMFGVFHLNAHQFIYTVALGFVLVYAVRVTGSIYTSMIIHFMNNGVSVTLQKIQYNTIKVMGETETIAEVANSVSIGDIAKIVATILVTGSIIFIILRELNKMNIVRGNIIKRELVSTEERIINLPLIMSVVVFIVFMGLFR